MMRGRPDGVLAACGVNLLPALEAEAKKRQEATSKDAPRDEKGHIQPVTSNLKQPETGSAASVAAKIVGSGVTQLHGVAQ